MRTTRSISGLIAAAGFAAVLNGTACAQTDFWLTVLHNNDGESQLVNAGTGLEDFGGAARFATVVNTLRTQAQSFPAGGSGRGSLTVAAGDTFLAGPEFNASLANGVPFFDTLAIELIGYDIAAIGNHEFDFGPETLADFLSGFVGGPTYLSANLDFSAEPALQSFVTAGRIAKSAVVTIDGRQVGVVGVTTPDLPFISSPRGVVVDPNIAAAVQAEVDSLAAGGVDIVLVLSHLQSVDAEIALGAQLRGVDAIIAGGGNDLLANAGDLLIPGDAASRPYPEATTDLDGVSVPVVSTPGDYRYVGRLILGFDAAGNLTEIDGASGPVRVAGGAEPDAVLPDAAVQAQVVDPVAAALAAQAATVVATTEVGLDGQRANVRNIETNLGNIIADAHRAAAGRRAAAFGVPPADVAIVNGGGIRNDNIIAPGTVSALDTFGILPFANFVSTVPNIPPEQFKEILENAVSRVPGNGRFGQISGFRMVVDRSRTAQSLDAAGTVTTAGDRVREVVLDDGTVIVSNGAVVAGAPAVSIATTDFSARGGDQYPFRGAPFTTLGISYEGALREFLQTDLGGTVSALDYPGPGESRIIDITAPAAVNVCSVDFNLDGVASFADVRLFVELYNASDLGADLDRNGAISPADVQSLVTLWGAGCP